MQELLDSKKCTKCGEREPTVSFYRSRHNPWCKSCSEAYKVEWRAKNRERINEKKNEWRRKKRATIPGYSRFETAREKYGLNKEKYMEMVAAAGGACEVCHAPTDTFHIDHNHTTGQVRGLLCRWCNYGLGNFRDNPRALAAAIAYLEKHGIS